MMETTTITKDRTEIVSGSLFVKFNTSRTEGKPFGRIDAYVYNGGDRIGSAFLNNATEARFFQERFTAITGNEWVAAFTRITEVFNELINETL